MFWFRIDRVVFLSCVESVYKLSCFSSKSSRPNILHSRASRTHLNHLHQSNSRLEERLPALVFRISHSQLVFEWRTLLFEKN